MPKHLHRLPEHDERPLVVAAEQAGERVAAHLRRRRFTVRQEFGREGWEVTAERGRSKEAGNLLFHLSLLVMLFGVAAGKLWGYEGIILVTEGGGFCNSFQQYDRYTAGPLVDQDDLAPLCFDLEDFVAVSSQTAPPRPSPPTSASRTTPTHRRTKRPSASTIRCA